MRYAISMIYLLSLRSYNQFKVTFLLSIYFVDRSKALHCCKSSLFIGRSLQLCQCILTLFVSHLCIILLQKKVREKSRECHSHKPQPFQDTKGMRKPIKPTMYQSNKRMKSTKISSLFPSLFICRLLQLCRCVLTLFVSQLFVLWCLGKALHCDCGLFWIITFMFLISISSDYFKKKTLYIYSSNNPCLYK